MAISFVAAGTPNLTTSTNPTVEYPAGLQAGDILFILDGSSGLTSPTAAGAGFAVVEELDGSSANQGLLWKRAVGDETGSATVTQSGSALKSLVMVCYRGCIGTGTPYEGFQSASGADTTTACDDVTTTSTDRLVVHFCSKDSEAATPTTPGTWDERVNTNTTSSVDATLHIFDKAQATAATVTGPDVTYSTSGEWFAQSLALIPAAAGGSTQAPRTMAFMRMMNAAGGL